MLKIKLVQEELFDEEKEEFVDGPSILVDLEHSLVSVSKWESIWGKPFLTKDEKSPEEIMSYVECMSVDPNMPPEVWGTLSQKNVDDILAYIGAERTATWLKDLPGRRGTREVVTSELIYYWMIAFQIPMEMEAWHLSRLFTMIRVCNAKNAPEKKMSRRDIAEQNRRLNEERLKKYNTTG